MATDTRTMTIYSEVIPVMVRRLVEGFQPLQVILFGSYARGSARSDSDVDLLVVVPSDADRHQLTVDMRRRLAGLGVAKDIVVTTPEEIAREGNLVGTVLRPALREGKLLYERPNAR
jgi:predicted nucleotidyltransferase